MFTNHAKTNDVIHSRIENLQISIEALDKRFISVGEQINMLSKSIQNQAEEIKALNKQLTSRQKTKSEQQQCAVLCAGFLISLQLLLVIGMAVYINRG